MNSAQLITEAYEEYRDKVVRFISYKISDEETARDIAQEVFLRLLEYPQLLYKNAMENFVFTIARNLVNDHLRRHYVKQEFDRYMMDYAPVSEESLNTVIADDIADMERRILARMPRQRAIIYSLRRYEEKSAQEIADMLGLSRRTVENHLYIGTHYMRESLRQCI